MPSKHEFLQDLKRVAADLGHAPSRAEYRALGKLSTHLLEDAFGGYTVALIAAGLQKAIQKPNKKDRFKDLHKASVDEAIKAVPQKLFCRDLAQSGGTLSIGDVHAPFLDKGALYAIYEFVERFKPKRIIQLGDLYDMFSHGKFPRSRCIFNPLEEVELGFSMVTEMWATLRRLSPEAECHQILGNHDVRPLKRILENYPEGEIFFSIEKYFKFDGVETHMDPRKPLILGSTLYSHGHLGILGAHRDFFNMNTVVGHSHRAGVVFKNFQDPITHASKILFELNAGFIGDPDAKALSYTPSRLSHWTKGVGYEDDYGPRFIPFAL